MYICTLYIHRYVCVCMFTCWFSLVWNWSPPRVCILLLLAFMYVVHPSVRLWVCLRVDFRWSETGFFLGSAHLLENIYAGVLSWCCRDFVEVRALSKFLFFSLLCISPEHIYMCVCCTLIGTSVSVCQFSLVWNWSSPRFCILLLMAFCQGFVKVFVFSLLCISPDHIVSVEFFLLLSVCSM